MSKKLIFITFINSQFHNSKINIKKPMLNYTLKRHVDHNYLLMGARINTDLSPT